MIWCSADGLREGVMLDVGVVMVTSQASLSEQTVAYVGYMVGYVWTSGNHL